MELRKCEPRYVLPKSTMLQLDRVTAGTDPDRRAQVLQCRPTAAMTVVFDQS